MKKVFKSRILLVIVTMIISSGISVYAAHKYAASNITYKDTTLDQALNTLYTTQNTTVSNLQSQVNSQTTQISDLQSQVETLTAAASEKDYVTGTFTFPKSGDKSCNLGFRPSKLILYYTTSSISSCIYYSGSYHYWFTIEPRGSGIDYNTNWFETTSTGFRIKNIESSYSESGKTYSYIAFK